MDGLSKHRFMTERFELLQWCIIERHGDQELTAYIHAHVGHDCLIEHSTLLFLWNPRVAAVRRQRAMFDKADRLSPAGAFYVAADVWSLLLLLWTKKNGKDWGLGKEFESFSQLIWVHSEILGNRPTLLLL
jgi:hypothetical protein